MKVMITAGGKENNAELDYIQPHNAGVNRSFFVVFCFCLASAFVLAYMFGLMPVHKGELVDTDCYMRLIRVTDLFTTGNWYHPSPMKTNTPYGDASHWTRPLDVLLLAGAVPVSFFTDFRTALFGWAVAISPVLMAVTLITLNWATKPLLSKDGTFLVVLLFLSQTVSLSYFQAARPDHHGLQVLLFVILTGLSLRIVAGPFSRSVCCITGAVGALSVWVSVESMMPAALSLGVMGLLWVLRNGDFLKKNLWYSMSLFVFSSAGLILERPVSDLFTVEYDRISIVHGCLLGLTALSWLGIRLLSLSTIFLQRRILRVCAGVIGLAAAGVMMRLLFPSIVAGPMADVDPRIIPIWFSKISEIKPLWSGSISLSMSLQITGTAVVSFVFLAYLFMKKGSVVNRKGWSYLAVFSGLFVAMSLIQVRWGVYAQTLLSIVMAELLCRILQWRKDKGSKLARAFRNALVILLFAWGFCYAGIIIERVTDDNDPEKDRGKVSLTGVCEYLNEDPKWTQRNLRILTHLNFAGEILYRTPHEVLGSNYHRNASGIMDTYTAMTAETDDESLNILRNRQINLILLCPSMNDGFFTPRQGQTSTFYQQLCDGQLPPWLKKVQLPEDLSAEFLLFEAVYDIPPQTTMPTSVGTHVYSTRYDLFDGNGLPL